MDGLTVSRTDGWTQHLMRPPIGDRIIKNIPSSVGLSDEPAASALAVIASISN